MSLQVESYPANKNTPLMFKRRSQRMNNNCFHDIDIQMSRWYGELVWCELIWLRSNVFLPKSVTYSNHNRGRTTFYFMLIVTSL